MRSPSGQGRLKVMAGSKQMGSERRPETNSQDLTLGTHETWPKVAIIVLNWNGWQDTIECLESLQRITYPNYQVIVVDNGSTDGSIEKIKAWARGEIPVKSKFFNYDPCSKPVQLIEYDWVIGEAVGIPEKKAELNQRMVLLQTGENLGFAGGSNAGIRYALGGGGDSILLLNNDTIGDREFLEPLVDITETHKDVGIVGPKVFFYDKPNIIQSVGVKVSIWTGRRRFIGYQEMDVGIYNKAREVNSVSGCALLMKRELIEKVGFLDEEYFLYGEDLDYCYRTKRNGYRILVAPASKIWHRESSSTGGHCNPTAIYYSTRNNILFVKKNGQWYHIMVYMLIIPILLLKRGFYYSVVSRDLLKARAIIKGTLWHFKVEKK